MSNLQKWIDRCKQAELKGELGTALVGAYKEAMFLQARVKELEEGRLEWQKKYHDCLHKNVAYNSEFIRIRDENSRLLDENFLWQSMEHNQEIMTLRGKLERVIRCLNSISDDKSWCGNEAKEALRELDGDNKLTMKCQIHGDPNCACNGG